MYLSLVSPAPSSFYIPLSLFLFFSLRRYLPLSVIIFSFALSLSVCLSPISLSLCLSVSLAFSPSTNALPLYLTVCLYHSSNIKQIGLLDSNICNIYFISLSLRLSPSSVFCAIPFYIYPSLYQAVHHLPAVYPITPNCFFKQIRLYFVPHDASALKTTLIK